MNAGDWAVWDNDTGCALYMHSVEMALIHLGCFDSRGVLTGLAY